jgi:hypothetical protein
MNANFITTLVSSDAAVRVGSEFFTMNELLPVLNWKYLETFTFLDRAHTNGDDLSLYTLDACEPTVAIVEANLEEAISRTPARMRTQVRGELDAAIASFKKKLAAKRLAS